MVQIVVHQLVPKTNQKKIRWEKKVQSSGRWRRLRFGGNVATGKKKCTVVWPAMFFSGFKLQPEKIMTRKIITVESSDRPFFPAGSNYNQKKLRPEK